MPFITEYIDTPYSKWTGNGIVNKKRKISYPADIMTSDKALASIEIASNGVKSRGWAM